MKTKRIICLILSMAILFCSGVITSVSATSTSTTNDSTTSNIKWNFNSKTNTLTFLGKGDVNQLIKDDSELSGNEYKNKIQHINFTKDIFSFDTNIFLKYPNLVSIDIDKNHARYSSKNGILFDKNKTKLLFYPSSKKATSFTVPNTVKIVENNAFGNNKYLKSVTLPNSVTDLGCDVFSNSESLEKVTLSNTIKVIKSGTFFKCDKLKNVNIPNSVKEIEYAAFCGCDSLKSLVIPNSITYIGYDAFSDCSQLETVTIPNSVTYIDYSCFFGDYKLKNLYYKGSEVQWYSIMVCYSYNNPYDENKDLYMGDDKEFNIGVNATIHFELKENEFYANKSLKNVNITNKNHIVTKGKAYSAKLTPKKGYVLTNVTVTMNGKTIKTQFNQKTCNIKIKKINGDIAISATAKKAQTISAKSFTKKKKSKPFFINAKAKTRLYYSSSNKKVATVNNNGKVTIKGVGKTTITIKASATSVYAPATRRITITVKK